MCLYIKLHSFVSGLLGVLGVFLVGLAEGTVCFVLVFCLVAFFLFGCFLVFGVIFEDCSFQKFAMILDLSTVKACCGKHFVL